MLKMEENWQGREQPHARFLSSTGGSAYQIKIDETRGFIITTYRDGSLLVRDLDNDEELWSLQTVS